LLGLADKVVAKFPGLGDAFSNMGDSFNNWVNEISKAGPDGVSPLDRAMKAFGGTLKQLGGIIVDLGKQGFEWLQDPEFGGKMERFAENLRRFVQQILPDLRTIFEGVEQMLNDLVTT